MSAMGVLNTDGETFVEVFGVGLDKQTAARAGQGTQAAEEGSRVTTDADVAVHQEDAAPMAFSGQPVKDGPAQGRSAFVTGPGDGGRADVHSQRGNTPPGQSRHQAARAAADVQDGADAAEQYFQVSGVRGGTETLDVQRQQLGCSLPLRCKAAQMERTLADAQRTTVGVGCPRLPGLCMREQVSTGRGRLMLGRQREVRPDPVPRWCALPAHGFRPGS